MAHRPPNTKPPMENSTPFDLNQALLQWRASLQNLGGFHAEELEELECHLRESISGLHARGLPVQEAFMIATRRLGSEQQLSDEFAKANPQRTWTERAMWMVAGVLGAYTVTTVALPISSIVMNCGMWSGLNGHLAGALDCLTGWIAWTGTAAFAFWVISRHFSRRDRVVQACIQRPVLTGLGLFIGLECLQYLLRDVNRLAEPMYNFFGGHHASTDPQTLAIIKGWLIFRSILTQVLWIAAGPLLVGYAWRKRQKPVSESPISFEVQPGEDEAVVTLQGQGLSLDEASLVLGRRRCPQEVVAPSFGLASSQGSWLERVVWMVTGVALSQWLELLVLNLGWLPVIVSRPAAPLFQHLTGLASACLSLMLGGVIIAGLWRWVTRHPSQSALIGSICGRRPLLATIALVAVSVGVGLSEYALFAYATKRMALPAQLGTGPIAGQWFMYSHALTQLIIPIALLLWLARRWRSTQTDPEPCR
jgi:hypothetical protein